MILPLLLIAILVLFLLRVPMAFAILGPSFVYLLVEDYSLHLMPQGLIYRSYLAGAKESRFQSAWNEEKNIGSIWDITLGGNVGLLRYGTRGDAIV